MAWRGKGSCWLLRSEYIDTMQHMCNSEYYTHTHTFRIFRVSERGDRERWDYLQCSLIVCSIIERFWWKQLSWEFRWDDWDDEWHACSCWKSQLATGLAGTQEWMNNKTIDRSQLICVNTARNYIASKLCMHCRGSCWARSRQAFAGGSDLRAACIIWWNACDDGIVEMMMIESTNRASLPCVPS